MENSKTRTAGYKWVVLSAFMFLTAMTQVLWITFAPITSAAAEFYKTSDLMIGLLSMSFMVIYIIVVIPCAWMIDTLGFRKAVSIGAVISALFALLRGVFASNFGLMLTAQLGIAIGQPLVLGAITKLAASWFEPDERATATGLGTLSIYLGILVAMIITPMLTLRFHIQGMLLFYGFITAASAFVFILVVKEPPKEFKIYADKERTLMFVGLKSMLMQKNFIILLVIFFIGLGLFNGVSTWVEAIVRPRGFSISQAGLLGGLMLIGGIIGAAIIPIVSDKVKRRKPFIILALIGLLPGLLGITFATSYSVLLVSGFIFGFFLLSSGPIGFQYGAEITFPAPEGTSNSLLIVMGQISGIIFIYGMDSFKSGSGSMTLSLLILLGLTVLGVFISLLLSESPINVLEHRKSN